MDDRTEKIGAALERLFRTYPQSDRGDALDVALERMERAKVYLEALEQYDIRDIEAGVSALISGAVPGVNPNFIPPAPVVGGEVRRQQGLRYRREDLDRIAHPRLPPPDVERTPECRARVKAMVEACVKAMAANAVAAAKPEAQLGPSIFERTNARFHSQRYFAGYPGRAADAAGVAEAGSEVDGAGESDAA